jgi:hypothetical protein
MWNGYHTAQSGRTTQEHDPALKFLRRLTTKVRDHEIELKVID